MDLGDTGASKSADVARTIDAIIDLDCASAHGTVHQGTTVTSELLLSIAHFKPVVS